MSDHPLRAAFHWQATACAALGSPFMERLCTHLATSLAPGTPLTDRLFEWPGDLTPRGASVPLRLCGALHALRLQNRAGLPAVYPPHQPDDESFAKVIAHALETESHFINSFITSAPQTNEVRRAATLIAAAHWIQDQHPMPMRLSELGASAGLNLNFDRFALRIGTQTWGPKDAALTLTPDWSGPVPPKTTLRISERRGVDLNPLDPNNTNDCNRLNSYLWPDQPERSAHTNAAISIATTAPDKADAIDWIAPRLHHIPGQLHMIYSTVAWQYFPPEAQEHGTQLIEDAGKSAINDSPLAWFSMETDGQPDGAKLTLRLWPGDHHIDMGRADFHGRWVNWQAPA